MLIVIFSVLMLMTISSFILPSDSAGKLTINGFSFMGSLLYLLYFGNTLPFHEVNVPVVGKYKMCERDYISIWFNNASFFCMNLNWHIFSVILYANHAAFTGIAIFFHTICIRMVTEDKSESPPRIFKFIFRGIFLKMLGLSEYEVK